MFLLRLALRLTKFALVFVVLLGVAWFFREPLLRGAAHAWVVDDPVAKADAIVVLGGGRDWRPFAAAEMYHAGQAPLILVIQPKPLPSQELLEQPTEADVNLSILEKKGVPADRTQRLGKNVTSTWEESLALREWVLTHQAKDIIIPTDPLHTRRVEWIFQRALSGTGATAHVRVVPHPRYTADNWWQEEEGFLGFQSEVMKSLYYLLRRHRVKTPEQAPRS